MKFLYLGQLGSGEEAVGHLNTAIAIMTRGRDTGGTYPVERLHTLYGVSVRRGL